MQRLRSGKVPTKSPSATFCGALNYLAEWRKLMPDYAFFLKNGQLEDHVLDLHDDTAAVEEGLRTASGMLRDLEVPEIGKFSQFLEIKKQGETLLQIEIHATRSR